MNIIILFIIIVLLLMYLLKSNRENYFTYYNGMPGIPKTYISPHFVMSNSCYQNAQIN